MQDTNTILRSYLLTQTALTNLIGVGVNARIYCPRVPDVGVLPCISLFRRGGKVYPAAPNMQEVSFQIDCWANDSSFADQICGAVEDSLNCKNNIVVIVNSNTYYISDIIEETLPQSLQDIDIPTRFRTLTFFRVLIQNH